MPSEQQSKVIDQFTKLAGAFASAPQFNDTEALDLLLSVTNASATDNSLDVACGAGVVAIRFATKVRHATGIDLTPAMLAQARESRSFIVMKPTSDDEYRRIIGFVNQPMGVINSA